MLNSFKFAINDISYIKITNYIYIYLRTGEGYSLWQLDKGYVVLGVAVIPIRVGDDSAGPDGVSLCVGTGPGDVVGA